LHADLVKQYEISDIMLLSPRANRVGDAFGVCTSCWQSTRLCKKNITIPLKHSIANGFVMIGHIPWYPKVHYPKNDLSNIEIRANYPDGVQTFVLHSTAYQAVINTCLGLLWGLKRSFVKITRTQRVKMLISKYLGLGQMQPNQMLLKSTVSSMGILALIKNAL
jgi:hypothetical protein